MSEKITKKDLKKGNILLCRIEHYSTAFYAGQVLMLLAEWAETQKDPSRTIHIGHYMPLIDYAITIFDQSEFYHAAYYHGDEDNTEDKKFDILEAGLSGVGGSPLSNYIGVTTQVLEFKSNDGRILDDTLDAGPVDAMGFDIASRKGDQKMPYGFRNAFLMAGICALRFADQYGEDEAVNRLSAALGLEVNDNYRKLWDYIRPAIALYIYSQWSEEEMMCSQFVSHIFNYQPDSDYHITRSERSAEPLMQATPAEKQISDAIQAYAQTILGELAENPPAKPLGDFDILDLLKDAFTPGDICASINTQVRGDLDLS